MPRPSPLTRFARYCRHDATTGCVMWTGGTTAGRGNSARYGAFWYDGRTGYAHRWAAEHIHGLDVAGVTVGHRCNRTLCVQHLERQSLADNVAEGNRRRNVEQAPAERRFWLLVNLGYEEPPPEAIDDPDAIPFFPAPQWLRDAQREAKSMSDDDVSTREEVESLAGAEPRACAWCGGKPVRETLDGDDLCAPCCDKWAAGEGVAAREQERDAAP